MILAHLVRGPWSDERLILPCDPEHPWPRFVIPERGLVVVQYLYLLCGPGDYDHEWHYLYDEELGLAAK
jgi:hypothetical protein